MGKENVNMLLFNKWDTSKIEVADLGLQRAMSLKPSTVIPISFGRHEHQRLKKAEVNIIERLANNMMHFGKRYAKNTGRMGGKKMRVLKIVRSEERRVGKECRSGWWGYDEKKNEEDLGGGVRGRRTRHGRCKP